MTYSNTAQRITRQRLLVQVNGTLEEFDVACITEADPAPPTRICSYCRKVTSLDRCEGCGARRDTL